MNIELGWLLQFIILTSIGAVSWFLKRQFDKTDTRIEQVDAKCENLKQDMSDLKSELPFIYVTREDYIRQMDVFDKKLDKIYDCVARGKNNG